MNQPKNEGDRCPQCGSTDLTYDPELYCQVCCTCNYEFIFDDETESQNSWDTPEENHDIGSENY